MSEWDKSSKSDLEQQGCHELSHIAHQPISTKRLNGKPPFEMLKFLNPEMAERFIQFSIAGIEKDKVALKPYLLKK